MMKEAHDFHFSKTGVGVEADEPYESFRAKLMAKCPFYFDLEEVFASRAGFNPKMTSKKLTATDLDFSSSESGASDDSESKDANYDNGEEHDYDTDDPLDDRVCTPNLKSTGVTKTPRSTRKPTKSGRGKSSSGKKRASTSTLRPKAMAKKSRRNRKGGAERSDPSFERMLVKLMKQKLVKDNALTAIAKLAQNFKTTSDCLGSRVRAAKACDKFVQFLTSEEKRELKELHQQDAEDMSDADESAISNTKSSDADEVASEVDENDVV